MNKLITNFFVLFIIGENAQSISTEIITIRSSSNSVCLNKNNDLMNKITRWTVISNPQSVFFPDLSCDDLSIGGSTILCGSVHIITPVIVIDLFLGYKLTDDIVNQILTINLALTAMLNGPIILGECHSMITVTGAESCVLIHPDNCAKTSNNLIIMCDPGLYSDVGVLMSSMVVPGVPSQIVSNLVYNRIGFNPKPSLIFIGSSLNEFLNWKILTCDGIKSLFTQGYYINKTEMYALIKKLGLESKCGKCKVGLIVVPGSSTTIEFGPKNDVCGCSIKNNDKIVVELNGPTCKFCTRVKCNYYSTID